MQVGVTKKASGVAKAFGTFTVGASSPVIPVRLLSLRLPLIRRLVTLLLLASLFACSKKVEAPVVPPTPLGMKWSLDGVGVEATNVYTRVSGTFPSASLEGYDALTGSTLRFSLPLPFATGTYEIVHGIPTASQTDAVYDERATGTGLGPHYLGRTGTLVVTRVTNSTVEGTFTLTAECAVVSCIQGSTKSITNGSFSCSR